MKSSSKLKWKYLRTRVYLERHHLKGYLLPTVIFIVISLSLVLSYQFMQFVNLWGSMEYATNNAFEFCESNRLCEAIVQPANTWSNLGFLMVGLLCLFIGINDLKVRSPEIPNLMVRYPIFSIILGISCIYLFMGSFLYHASLTKAFQKLDITGMYAVILSFIGYMVFRLYPTRYVKRKEEHRSSHFIIAAAAVLLNVVFFAGLWKINVNVLFPIFVLIAIATNVIYNRLNKAHYQLLYKRIFQLSMLVGLISFTCWILDRQDIWCSPDSFLQGHAVWHILNALCIFLLYLSLRVEKIDIDMVYKGKQNVYLNFK